MGIINFRVDDNLKKESESKGYVIIDDGFNENYFVFGDVAPIHPHTMKLRKKKFLQF